MHGSSNVTPVPRDRDQFDISARPTVLYQAAGVTVTTGYFEFAAVRYPVAELSEVERVEHGGRWRAGRYELWAQFRGRSVRLFHTHQSRVFGQVCRALMRAREYAGLA